MTSATCKPNSSFPLKPLTAAMLLVFSAHVQTAPVLQGALGSNLDIDVSVPGTTTIIQEVNQRDLIDWQEFSIGTNETVHFNQPHPTAVIVNRVNGGNISEIFGSLTSDGRIFLINPSGIVFGAGSEVNVGSLVASTLRVRPESLNNETLEFRAFPDSGSITNEGRITGKDIVLLAPSITNADSGLLTASGAGAAVNLIAAQEVTVNTSGSDLVVQAAEGHNNALIEQLGQVMAEGGRIILLASAANNGAPSVINTAGVNQASQITIQGDQVQLTGSFNAGNPNGVLDVQADDIGQIVGGQSQGVMIEGALNLTADNVNLNDVGNDFTGRVDLSVEESVTIRDSNDLLISGVADSVDLNAENITMSGLNIGSLDATAIESISQLASVQVSGSTELNANEITLTNQANNFDGEVRVNSTGQTTMRTSGRLNISGSAAQLDLTAGEITQNGSVFVGGESTLRASHITLGDAENDFTGDVALSVTGEATLNDKNNLSVGGSSGATNLTALGSVQLNNLNAESLNVTAASVAQSEALTVQQDTTLTAGTVQLADPSNNFGGNVALNNVTNAELHDADTLTLSGQVGTLTATAANITQIEQTGPLVVNNTATFNAGNVELLQAGNAFGSEVLLNVDGHAQLATAGGLTISGSAGSATFTANSIGQGTTEVDALTVLGETRINNSNTVDLMNDVNQFGSAVILNNAGTVNLKGNEVLTVQGSAGDTALTAMGADGRLVVNGLNVDSLTATATHIDQTAFLNVTGNSTLSAQRIDLTASDINQFGGTVNLSSGENASIDADGTLTVTGSIDTGNFEAGSLVFNGLAASNGLTMSAGNITQSMDADRALSVQGETRINNSGAVTLNNAMNDFQGDVLLDTQGDVGLTDTNTLVVQGQTGTLNLTAQTIEQNGAIGVSTTTTLNADTITLNDSANDFQGQVILNSGMQATLQDANTLSLAGNAQDLVITASTVEINDALNVNENLTLTANRVNQNASGASSLTVNGTTSIQHLNNGSNALVRLNNANNNFVGTLTLNNQVNVELHDQNTLTLQGNAGSLTATATEIKQAGDLSVASQTTLDAGTVTLLNQLNDFQGLVNLDVTDTTNLRDANNLRVAGNVNTATLNANTLTVEGLSALGNVTFNAVSTGQNGALSVAGISTFNGDSVTLENSANSFNDVVNFNLTGVAAITASGALDVTGDALEVNAKADSLAVSAVSAQDITLQADQLALNNFNTAGNLTLNGGNVIQQGALQVGGTTTLGASNVTLQDEGNRFTGNVVLGSAGNVSLRDQESIALQGSAASLNVQASTEVSQSAALNISGTSNLTASTVHLDNSGNNFGGAVTVNATEQATVNASGNLSIQGNATALTAMAQNELRLANSTLGTLNATAQQITQSDAVTVTGEATLTAQNVTLINANNDFSGSVTLDVTEQASIADRNSLLIRGNAQTLSTAVAHTLTVGELDIVSGTLSADQIKLNQLRVSESAELRADKVTQTVVSQSGGTLTIRADEVDLAMNGNDFSGQLILQNVGTAIIHDTNDLTLSGRVNTLTVNAQRITQQQDQAGALNIQGKADLRAANVDLQNAANNFSGVVDLQVSDTALLRDVNSLTVQGDVGTLRIRAGQLSQADSLTVRNNASIEAASVQLNNPANDFQGEVALTVAGATVIADANVLNVSGQLNGAAELRAQSIEQTGALTSNSSVLLQADRIDLGNQGNVLNGAVRVEGASHAVLGSTGTLRVQGADVGELNLHSQVVSLGELGELQQLDVTASEIGQTAVLNVRGDTKLKSNKVDLNNAGNDFVGQLEIQNLSAGNSVVSVADRNNLAMQGENLELTARIQGNFQLQANNVELGDTQVEGASQIELTGSLTQNRSVNLSNASLKAGQITLSNSGNRFIGNTQVESGGAVALGTSGGLNVNTTSSTGTLALDVGGDAVVSGRQVRFADSQFDGELAVSANQVSQTGRLRVDGDAVLEAIGGEINLQHAGNRFQGMVSASAEQTSLSTVGDMALLNLNSRGGQLTADGRMLLLGDIEQTGGVLTFTAKGISRPLSSADIALLLPPSLDVFSTKEAVNPITGLGRITLTSPMIHQRSGQLVTAAGATTQFNSPENGSIILTQNNQINGQVAVLAGQNYGQTFAYVMDRGASLFAVNNDVRLRVGGQGAEADVIAIRARGLATQGNDAVIHARMPYNDIAVGTARSYAGLTLSIPLGSPNGQPGGLATFGESAGSGQSPGAGAIRVEVGDVNRPGLGGFLTVLPFEGSNLLPGQVVYLAGPERKGTQAFFYDGARSLDRIPVVYNGTLLLSPQENAALTTAQGAVVLARQEQTRSVVRTENVAGKIINGVVAEVGPGRPATEGEGGAGKPATCDTDDSGLSCAP